MTKLSSKVSTRLLNTSSQIVKNTLILQHRSKCFTSDSNHSPKYVIQLKDPSKSESRTTLLKAKGLPFLSPSVNLHDGSYASLFVCIICMSECDQTKIHMLVIFQPYIDNPYIGLQANCTGS